MNIKPSELPKFSIIQWGACWYIKFTESLFMMIDPFMMQKPFIVSDDPKNTPRQRYNMSVVPSDRFFHDDFADDLPTIVSVPKEAALNIAEELAAEIDHDWHSNDTGESVLKSALMIQKEKDAQAHQEGTRPPSASADGVQPTEPEEEPSRGEGFEPDYGRKDRG